jgi:uncharacterized HhH-GPD family protein
MTTEETFHQAMIEVYRRAKQEADYNATKFIEMVANLGGLETAKRLLHTTTPSDGFLALWKRNRLDLTVENVVIRPEFSQLFTADEIGLAIERLRAYGLDVPPALRPSPKTATAPAEPVSADAKAIGQALLHFAESTRASAPPSVLTGDPSADDFVRTDPFAFLLAVIFDQAIDYRRAWQAPYELRRRLGHLDPGSLAADPESVRQAIRRYPALHRYVEKLPRWVVSAASRVIRQYGGDAGAIWSDDPTARELIARLEQFDGISQKKAAMAVEILERELGVPIRSMEGSDIAFDIHVRRVFLRTGLAERDDQAHMVAVARRLNPDRPGALDDPAWRIGQRWCRPRAPDCPDCPLTDVCPKLIERGNRVFGP